MARKAITGSYGLHLPLRVVPPKPRKAKRVWYKPNHKSFGAFMRSEQMRAPVADVADDIMATAIIDTERSSPDEAVKKGSNQKHLQDSYGVKREAGLIKVNTALRVVVHVTNDAPHAAANEFGKDRRGGNHSLRDAGAKFGDLKLKSGD